MQSQQEIRYFDVDRRDDYILSRGWKFVGRVGEDCAFRKYFRIRQGRDTAILMESLPDHAAQATPGHKIADFIRIGQWLRDRDIHAPAVYECDAEDGFLILEDFGDTSFKGALERGANASAVYSFATDILRHLGAQALDIDLPDYCESHVHKGRRRIVDWYMPLARGEKIPDGLVESYLAVWNAIESGLPPCPQSFCHGDFHVENLMWFPEGEGLGIAGVLDFQGAMKGPRPYDLANLLEDARMDPGPVVRWAMVERYCAGMSPPERELFKQWYRVLATQFHCRVIGQFVKLAMVHGKPRYLQHLPRLAGYMKESLQDPLLMPLRQWFESEGLDFERGPVLNDRLDPEIIRDDAF
ncbi:MAG: phosphotransferase [Alphaproteobacteria bacterium]|nr:phosphotransferase [Alphaproteobacteria bacterium]